MLESEPVIVIGTGPAGATAAVFLRRAGLKPLILEAGSRDAWLGFTARVRGMTVAKLKPTVAQRADLTRATDPAAQLFEALAPGGLSNHWACAVPRFADDDFDDAVRAGDAYTWPLSYRDLEPWYQQVEPLLRIAGSPHNTRALPAGRVRAPRELGADWDAIEQQARALGRDVVAMPYAYGSETLLTRSATQFNAYTRLLKPHVARGELAMRFDALALSLEWSPSARRVTAVLVRDQRTGSEERIPCRAVVLAAGAVNSAQILLESLSADFPSGLGNSHDLVGRYLHDHPLAKIVIDLGRRVEVAPASYITRPQLTRTRPLYAGACMQWASSNDWARTLLAGTPGRAASIGFSIFGTMIPTEDDRVELDRKHKNGSRSRLLYSLRYPELALNTLRETRDDLLEIMTRAGWQPRERVFKIEPPGNSVHYGGTCRMHASPELGVVDAWSRVHGVPNVVVADSGVFTTGPEKNPVLTAMTLSARASERLAREIQQGDL